MVIENLSWVQRERNPAGNKDPVWTGYREKKGPDPLGMRIRSTSLGEASGFRVADIERLPIGVRSILEVRVRS